MSEDIYQPLKELAAEAVAIVTGSRRDQYGGPERTFGIIAAFWTTYLRARGINATIAGSDVSPMMRLMKEARLVNHPGHRDSLVDIIGYTLTDYELSLDFAEVVTPAKPAPQQKG